MLDKQILKDPQGLPQWEKDFIDRRLDMIQNNPERLKPAEMLFEIL